MYRKQGLKIFLEFYAVRCGKNILCPENGSSEYHRNIISYLLSHMKSWNFNSDDFIKDKKRKGKKRKRKHK